MRFIFRLFTSNKTFTKKISELENKISSLESKIIEVKTEVKSISVPADKKEKDSPPTVQINHLQVDQIVIEHLDYANNFGQLGIKELSGKLNIGSTYEGDISEKVKEIVNQKLGKEATVNIKAKKEE
ncbi:hypothetical protein FB550_10272 [Neobacillus bataviensis]|uniref:Uncharacterized protein n=1 Tax=Neobacillus bataviensis TaxID=220685 RepID=A0A561DRP7_9BACI|nr:hypothetical protein [Neobacillus bataviensis]TWE06054.1 hypothetical protein FB550_10272 [Neobacillus bataviensis]